MASAKEIRLKVIPANIANAFIKRYHYSGKVASNSRLHFGVFLEDRLHGALSFGSPLDKRKVMPLVQPSKWNEMLELNRMAFDDILPKNSESRALAIAIRLIRKNAPHIKWILSFADGAQCGDGTIYRASGFQLTAIKENSDLMQTESGKIVHTISVKANKALMSQYGTWKAAMEAKFGKFKPLPGFQLRYIYLLDKSCKISVPIIPFSKIEEIGASMYKGKKILRGKSSLGIAPSDPVRRRGSNPPSRSTNLIPTT